MTSDLLRAAIEAERNIARLKRYRAKAMFHSRLRERMWDHRVILAWPWRIQQWRQNQ